MTLFLAALKKNVGFVNAFHPFFRQGWQRSNFCVMTYCMNIDRSFQIKFSSAEKKAKQCSSYHCLYSVGFLQRKYYSNSNVLLVEKQFRDIKSILHLSDQILTRQPNKNRSSKDNEGKKRKRLELEIALIYTTKLLLRKCLKNSF